MKRALFAAAASLLMIAPIATPTFAQPGPDRHDSRGGDRNDNRGGPSHDHRKEWRDARKDARWDAKVHNGYYIKNTWHAGQPSAAAYKQAGFQLAYKPWKKGDRLGDSQKRYVEVDYRQRNLPAPPKGQHYVRDDNTGDIILAAIATGVIVSILSN